MPFVLSFVSLIPCIIFWKTPALLSLILLISTGLTAFLAHVCVTRAFSSSDATFVLIFDYLRLPITAILAFFIWRDYFYLGMGRRVNNFFIKFICSLQRKKKIIIAKKHH